MSFLVLPISPNSTASCSSSRTGSSACVTSKFLTSPRGSFDGSTKLRTDSKTAPIEEPGNFASSLMTNVLAGIKYWASSRPAANATLLEAMYVNGSGGSSWRDQATRQVPAPRVQILSGSTDVLML